ncbi:MAG: IS1634 family transposase [Deltaproteobacteria bacterium]|nr:IS1634 family transposase [Deltaproteobacteria bacterium]
MLPKGLTVEAHPLGPLPLVNALITDLGIRDVVSELCPRDPRSQVGDADCVAAMVMNILGGRIALYRMESWTRKLPVWTLFGPGIEPEHFSDARLARCLDHLFEAGSDTILSRVVQAYLAREERSREYCVHHDTTSVSVYGAYEGEPPGWAPRMVYGFSKDHRPDLKQLVFGLSLHGSAGLPLMSTMFDGNTSDKFANTFHIEGLAGLLPEQDDVTLVGDSKLVDAQTLGGLLDAGFHFVSLVSRSFKVRRDLVDRFCDEGGQGSELGRTAPRRKKDPPTLYTGRSYTAPLTIQRPGQPAEKVDTRFVVVRSSALVEKVERQLPKRLGKEEDALKKRVAQATRERFACYEDAQKAAARLESEAKLWRLVVGVEQVEVPAKRGRGRPKKGQARPTETHYQLVLEELVVDPQAIEADVRSKTHFVLVTDHHEANAWPDTRVFAEYRHQHLIEGHAGFRWIKGPGQVAPLLLKKPERIEALGLVLILALMVRNYVQWTVREALALRRETIPYYNRKRDTHKPTAEVVWELFSELQLVIISLDGQVERVELQGMDIDKERVLQMLGLSKAELLSRRSKSRYPAGGS